MNHSEREEIRHFLILQDLQGKRLIPLKATSYSLGRDPKNPIVLNAQAVSRHHAMLLRVTSPDSDRFWFRLVDGGLNRKRSTNGVYVNGRRVLSHDLRHGDLLEFGVHAVKADYYALSNLTHGEYQELCQAPDPLAVLSQFSADERATIISEPLASSESSEASILRLASFPELMEIPVVELETGGSLTYLNPAALQQFPDLRSQGTQHPVLHNLREEAQAHGETRTWHRMVKVDHRFFDQAVHYLAESELLRVFMTDVTARHRAEVEVRQRDRLLRAMAKATSCLLMEMDHGLAINQALAIMGEAIGVDRVCIYENHSDPHQGAMAMSLRFEWVKPGVESLLNQPISQNRGYEALGLTAWYQTLQQGRLIQGQQSDFNATEQGILLQDQVRSILMQGLMSGVELWGHVSFHDCRRSRTWSSQESALLLTLSSSLSAALERRQVEETIRYRATHDSLTGLGNRSAFDETLIQALQSLRDQDRIQTPSASLEPGLDPDRASNSVPSQQLGVLFLDLDRFKEINDRLGHNMGDYLLQEVAHRLQPLVSPASLFRWGGDEFTLLLLPEMLLPGTDGTAVDQCCQTILAAFNDPFQVHNHELYVSVSIGAVVAKSENCYGLTAETLVRQADVALYKAKNQGRHTYAFYRPEDGSGTVDLELERDLRHALERQQLEVFYQPQVNLSTQIVMGVEALLRWRHPDRGLISPGIFIPMAEDRGWIVDIGEWVLHQACVQAKAWQLENLASVVMSVNLSLRQFRQPNLVDMVQRILTDTGLEPRYLELEITESVAIEDLEFTRSLLDRLHDLGVRLSIDDFGTGYSSLNRLQTLPLDTLKIDKSFMRELPKNTKVSHIVSAIVTLGLSLGLDLIAEGVEQPEQAQFLKSIHCQTAQGFLFHRPMTAAEVALVLGAMEPPSLPPPPLLLLPQNGSNQGLAHEC
ncbi:EAL domain-containing protein [Prochlorothrix hollandica]|uniref:EAL domain-containing protein n=2 Tax=Prochlorothrix hollandica TaxID=1223 RepID=UPI000374AC4F|nr:EAL domain-containing protein [Prochlorothrix hollandica]